MGGFILAKKNAKKINISNALNIFVEKKMTISKQMKFLDYELFVYQKTNEKKENFFQFNNDFIVATGTPLYKQSYGESAIEELYSDFKENINIDFTNFNGSFCYIIFINSKLYLLNDFNGTYHVFHDSDQNIFSTSFLAVNSAIKQKNINPQALYEYIFYGASFGADTLVGQIERMNNKFILQLTPNNTLHEKEYNHDINEFSNLDEYVEFVAEYSLRYFKTLGENFKSFSLGLSGGFDSRLILSLFISNNIMPLIYTGGTRDSLDIVVAKKITEDLGLEFINYSERESLSTEQHLMTNLHERFIKDEGFVLNGFFISSLDMDYEIAQKSSLNLNGGGGEIYREFWKLPSKNIHIDNFLNTKFKDFSNDIFKDHNYPKTFFDNFSKKIISSLDMNINSKILNDRATKLIYPNFRLRYWTGPTSNKINQYSLALLPFAEPMFYLDSLNIPLNLRVSGIFEAALIKKISPELAKYNSSYGFNFFDGPNLKHKLADWLKIYSPISARPPLRKIKSKSLNGLHDIKIICQNIFGNNLEVSKYINLDEIEDVESYSRLLTIEYFIRNFV